MIAQKKTLVKALLQNYTIKQGWRIPLFEGYSRNGQYGYVPYSVTI